ncbi:MAG: hypothetical protein RLP44_01145 [Aggregatilineales bacterium]
MKMPDMSMFEDDESSYWNEPDAVLTNIVAAYVNVMDMPIGITLFVKGMVISGTLVSEREYLKRLTATFTDMAKQVIQPKTKKEREVVEDMFNFQELEEGWYPDDDGRLNGDEEDVPDELATSAQVFDNDVDADEDDDRFDFDLDVEEMPPTIRHLHLTDVSIVTPQPTIAFGQGPMPYLRMRLTMVDGWILGHSAPYDNFEPYDDDDESDKTILH